jgi:ankyrin repeat protein
MSSRIPRRRFVVASGLSLIAGAACKPATPREQFRRALRGSDPARVQAALAAGQSATEPFEDSATPLHVAAGATPANAEIAHLLLEAGADVQARDWAGKTPWDLVWEDERAMWADTAAFLAELVDAGYRPSVEPVEGGRTLLHQVAARCPSTRLTSRLIDTMELDVHARDDNGWTPLHDAAMHDNADAAVALLDKGADVNAQSTKTFGKSQRRGETEIWAWRYDAGSQPLDVAPYSTRRGQKSVRDVLQEYRGAKNPDVHNKRR